MSKLPSAVLSFIKETLTDGVKTLTSKEGLKRLYRVSLYRNAIYLIMHSAVTAILSFVFWILAARFYSAEEVGLASATLVAANFLAILATLGLDYGLIRFLPNSGEKSNVLVNSCLTVSVLAAIVFSFIFLAGLNIWTPALIFLRQNLLYVSGFTILVMAGTFCFILQNAFIAHRRAAFALWQGMISGVTKLALVIPLAASLYAFGIVASLGMGFLVAVMVGLLFLLPRLQSGYHPFPTIRKEVISEIAHFSFANYIVAIIGKVCLFVLPLMVINLLGAEQTAYFYIAFTIVSSGLVLIPVGISLSLFAEGSYSEESLGQDVSRSLKLSFLLFIPLMILIFFVGDKILLLFGEGYSMEATRLLQILVLSCLPITVNSIYFAKKRVQKKMKSVVGLTAFITVMTLTLSYFLLPVMGIIGAGIAWLISHSIVMFAVMRDLVVR